jgi:hypothetical protein
MQGILAHRHREFNRVRLIPNSGRIGEKSAQARLASDHFIVHCDVEIA